MAYSRFGPPSLKKTVDLQLQSAFADANWATAARLADKRAKTLKDPYYEAIKICAESQFDGPAESCAVLVAVDDLVKKGTAVGDLETIELYEWACRLFADSLDYAESLGLLRFRWAKANPKNSSGVAQCLQACLQNWDLVNAQQIAAILDKSSSSAVDRKYMFWSITLTYLLSISPQCPEGKQKLYGLLALKQLDRAADLTEASVKDDPSDRGLRKEEEISLYYRVLAAEGSKLNFMKRIKSPRLGSLSLFEKGQKHLFLESLDAFEKWDEWDAMNDFCLSALAKVEGDGTPSFLASDWRVWKRYIAAASQSSDDQRAFGNVKKALETYVAAKTGVAQMYKKNIAVALLEMAFRLPQSLLHQEAGVAEPMPRVTQLCLFIDHNFDRASVFDDIKGYVSDLTFEEANHLITIMFPKLIEDDSKPFKNIYIRMLELKLRYLLTTCPQTLSNLPSIIDGENQTHSYRCRVCSSETPKPCGTCLTDIVTTAASLHREASSDSAFTEAIPTMDKDPRTDLSLVIAMSALKLAGFATPPPATSWGAPLHRTDPALFLKAVLVLDTQLKETPGDTALRLLLVRLYLLLGCASYAYQLWGPLDVKRTIQDALSPLFFDRIYSLSPGLFQGSRSPTEPLRSYYASCLRDVSPVRMWDAFVTGNYTSILDIAEFDSRLRRGCTLVMSVVEERRATQAFGGRLDTEIGDMPLLAHIQDDTELVNSTDYGSLPSLESPSSPSIQDLVQLGPGLSNERAHLSLLAEKFLDLVSWKPPKDYKPSRPAEAAAKERTYLVETLARLHNSLTSFLHLPATPQKLTAPEEAYFTIVSLLSAILLAALASSPGRPPSPATLSVSAAALKSAFSSLRAAFLAAPPTPVQPQKQQPDETLAALVDMHTMSTLRDAAAAARLGASLALSQHEKGVSGGSGLHRDAVAELRALEALGAKAFGEVRGRIKTLRAGVGAGSGGGGAGWLDRVLEWTLGPEEPMDGDQIAAAVSDVVGGRAGAEEWASKVLESWREGIKGWGNVRME